MKTEKHLGIIFFLLASGIVMAQDQEWKTYYGEVVGFQINYPDSWQMGAADKKKSASALVVYNPLKVAGMVVLIQKSPYTLSKEMNTHISVVKKDAKKAKDGYFKIIGEGNTKTSSGEKSQWVEYTETSTVENGTVSKQTIREYMLTNKKGLALSGDFFAIKFYAPSETWQDNAPIFEKMFQSLKLTKK